MSRRRRRPLLLAALLACVARGTERMPSARSSSMFFGRGGAARPSAALIVHSAARRPHGLEALGSKKKRKFRGGVDWDDSRLYDEWIKAGAPDEFDFSNMGEIDLDSPPETTVSIDDEELETKLAEQLLARAESQLQREPMSSSRDRPFAPEQAAWTPASAQQGLAEPRRRRRVGVTASASEEEAIAAALERMPSASARWSPDALDGQGAEGAGADAPYAAGDGRPSMAQPRGAGSGASVAAASAAAAIVGRGGAPPGSVDLLGLAEQEEQPAPAGGADDGRSRYEAGSETSGVDMPGWERVGHSWTRVEPPKPPDPEATPRYSVPCPPSLKAYILARQAGQVEETRLWPDTHWRAAWATAVDEKQHRCLKATWANFNVKIVTNFEDVPDLVGDTYGAGDEVEGNGLSIADEALMKAEMAFAASGLPSIADASSLELLANPNSRNDKRYVFRGQMTERVDELMLKLRPLSAPNRVALFHTAVAFSNGTHRVIGDGMCAAALLIANSSMATIARSAAYDDMLEKLARTFSLRFTGPNVEAGGSGQVVLPSEQREAGKEMAGARLLRERILRDGKVLDSGILKVSSFINHQVDVNLIEACGEELAVRLERTMPNKILTVEATGLIPAIFVARYLQVPVVFARKQRPLTISDAYTVSYRSATKGTMAELIVSEEYLCAGDRVLLIDDFLAGGSTAEALFKLIKMANAKVVGVGVLIEKLEGSGRAFLSGYEVPVQSLVKVRGLESGRVDVIDEEPFIVPESRGEAGDRGSTPRPK